MPMNRRSADTARPPVRPFSHAVTLAAIAVATGLRIWPLGALELRIPWVTFYPAVMGVALYGGVFTGLSATALSALVVLFWSPTGQPFIDDFGDWLGMAVFLVNGTLISMMSGAMHRAKERATQARKQAEAANRAKSVFLANMSHELRTPLNAILGFADLMRKSPDATPGQKSRLDIIVGSGQNLLNLINNVLDISKIEAGHMMREDVTVNPRRLLREVEALMSLRVAERKLVLDVAPSRDLPDAVTLDAGKLRQILINLIANAVKYTEKGGVSVRAGIRERPSPDTVRLRFEVEDSGIGIPKEEWEAIFAPFHQIGDQPATESGTGLGLAICRQFTELLGGHIGVTSVPGKGSIFHFDVLAGVPGSSGGEPAEKGGDGLPHGGVLAVADDQPSHRLLIAEDKRENRLLLRQLLEPLGFDIREAVNGRDALEEAGRWRPHLVWMDIRMPVMNGLEATRRIKANPELAGIKIVALTAHALEEERVEILEAGCDDFIRKPYRDTDIFDALARHLGVRFRHADEKTPADSAGPPGVDEARLGKIPPDLLRDLTDAAVLLDGERCLQVVGGIEEHDPELGKGLRHMLGNLEYREVLAMLDALNREGAP